MNEKVVDQMSGTADGLVAFLDWAGLKGVMSRATTTAYKTAVSKVFEIDDDAWHKIVVKGLDVELQLERFARLRGSKYSPESLRTYCNRFRAAVSSYIRYLDDPANFRSGSSVAGKAKRTQTKRSNSIDAAQNGVRIKGSQHEATSTPASKAIESDLVQYPFPLRNGVMAYLMLPKDLRKAEATRIAAFVASLAIDPTLELSAGTGAIE
jgi:hypothetical protein